MTALKDRDSIACPDLPVTAKTRKSLKTAQSPGGSKRCNPTARFISIDGTTGLAKLAT
jgi:hypothetical protein